MCARYLNSGPPAFTTNPLLTEPFLHKEHFLIFQCPHLLVMGVSGHASSSPLMLKEKYPWKMILSFLCHRNMA